jgi:menaquinol-cytochrome c reductase iron-sulfur subunit
VSFVMTDPPPNRRRLLTLASMALLCVLTGLIGAPVLAFITSPLRKRGGPEGEADAGAAFADAGPLDAVPAGQWKLIPIEIVRQDGWAKSRESRSVWVWRAETSGAAGTASDAGAVKVRSPICTHLGCPIMLAPDGKQFRCPCHGGTFDLDTGKHVAGPPPRDMDSLDFELRSDGHLWIRWQDFKIGVSDRVPVRL